MTDEQLVAEPLTSEMEVAACLARTLREQQTLLQSADIGVAFIRQRTVVRCSARFAHILGYTDEVAMAGLSSQALHPDKDAFRALGRDAYPCLSAGRTFRTTRQLCRYDGSLFWANLTGRLIHPEDPGEGSIWTVDDIDAEVQLRSALDSTRPANPTLA